MAGGCAANFVAALGSAAIRSIRLWQEEADYLVDAPPQITLLVASGNEHGLGSIPEKWIVCEHPGQPAGGCSVQFR